MNYMYLKTLKKKLRTTKTEVFVATAQKNLLEERMKILKILWENEIKVCTYRR